MKGASRPVGMSHPVQEDAGAVHHAGDSGAVFLHLQEAVLVCLLLVLPVGGGESRRRVLDVFEIVVIDEMSSVGAAAMHQLGGRSSEHTLATLAVDTCPRTIQKREVEHPCTFLV